MRAGSVRLEDGSTVRVTSAQRTGSGHVEYVVEITDGTGLFLYEECMFHNDILVRRDRALAELIDGLAKYPGAMPVLVAAWAREHHDELTNLEITR